MVLDEIIARELNEVDGTVAHRVRAEEESKACSAPRVMDGVRAESSTINLVSKQPILSAARSL